MQYISWSKLTERMIQFNTEHGYTSKGNPEHLTGVVTFTQDSFSKPYTEKQRTYKFTSDNKAFLPSNIGYSIFADCIDGTDNGVRIEQYMRDSEMPWKVEKCYIEEDYNAEDNAYV